MLNVSGARTADGANVDQWSRAKRLSRRGSSPAKLFGTRRRPGQVEAYVATRMKQAEVEARSGAAAFAALRERFATRAASFRDALTDGVEAAEVHASVPHTAFSRLFLEAGRASRIAREPPAGIRPCRGYVALKEAALVGHHQHTPSALTPD